MIEISSVIYELVKLLSNNKLHINYPWKENSKYNEYFYLIKNNNKLDENDISLKLGYESKKDKSFIRLQQRFENKLSYLLFAIDLGQEKGSDYAKSVQTIVLFYSQGKLLMQRRLTPVGMYYLNKAMILSKNIYYTEYEYLLNIEFYKYYSSIDLNNRKSKTYLNALNQSKLVLEAELEVKGYERELLDLVSKNIDIKSLKSKSKIFALNSKKLLDHYFSYSLAMTSFQIIVFKLNLFKEFDEIYLFCLKIKNLLLKHKISGLSGDFLIDKVFINAYISNHDFKGAYLYMNNNDSGIQPGSHSYFSRMNQKFQVLIRFDKHHELLELVSEVFSFNTLEVYSRIYELWLIKKGYIHLFIELGGIKDPTEEFESITNYKLYKLLNQISIYAKDKSGHNAALRILEMCFYLVRKDEDKLIDKIETVQQYAYKYLKKDENLRFRIFIRMLIQCHKRRYNVIAIKRHTAALYDKLEQNPQLFIDSVAEAEVIPLELLWEKLLQFIEENYKQ